MARKLIILAATEGETEAELLRQLTRALHISPDIVRIKEKRGT